MRIAICDDNMDYINTINTYIDRFKETKVDCHAYQSGEELIKAYRDKKERYDAIFLDMEMEELNGIATANHIRDIDEHVIIVFVTSHTEYMRESFKCAPFRFLVKPVDDGEFEGVFCDICKKLSKQRRVFAFTENKAKVRLYCDDIIFCESQDHWIWIHTRERTYKVFGTLTELHRKLGRGMFCRMHKSFVVNLHYVRIIRENTAELYHYDKPIPISRSYKKEVLEEYTLFLERDFTV